MKKIYISNEHRYGTDSILLSEFAANSTLKNKVTVDLCSGCGIIPLMLCNSENCPKTAYCLEIQEEAAELIRQNRTEHELANVLQIVHGDLRCERTLSQIGRESVDVVTANPPYYKAGSGFERSRHSQKVARYDGDESGCKLDEVVRAAAYLLKYGGVFKMCMTASRLAETIGIFQAHSLEPKEIILIGNSSKESARLFLINGKKGGKSGVKVIWK
jgi:tRNA1(Val) A37 N6-methylase TrmN6